MVQVTNDPRKIWMAISALQAEDEFPDLDDMTVEGTPANGDFVIIYGAEGDLRVVDWADLPGAGSGISNLHEDLTPQLGANLDLNNFDITGTGDINITGSVTVTDEAYDATGWDSDLSTPTKNAVRDKIETLQPLDSDLTAIAALTTTAAGRSVLTVSDDAMDELVVWDDTAGTMKTMPLADFTTEGTPATGDYVIIYGAEGDVRKADWSTLPGAGGGISNVSEDTTPQLGGDLDLNGFDITGTGTIGARAHVISATVSATATIDIDLTPYTSHRGIRVTFWDFVPATDNVNLFMRFSDDGGSTFEADAADYFWLETYAAAAGVFEITDTSDSSIQIGSVGIGSTTYERIVYMEVTIVNPQGTGFTNTYWHGSVYASDGITYHIQGTGAALVAGASTDVRFLFSTGNMESGYYTVEAIL
jgi:hypothetical protein